MSNKPEVFDEDIDTARLILRALQGGEPYAPNVYPVANIVAAARILFAGKPREALIHATLEASRLALARRPAPKSARTTSTRSPTRRPEPAPVPEPRSGTESIDLVASVFRAVADAAPDSYGGSSGSSDSSDSFSGGGGDFSGGGASGDW